MFIIDALTTIFSAGLILFFVKGKAKVDQSSPQIKTEQSEIKNTHSIFSFLYGNPILIVFSIILLVFNFCYIQWNFMIPLQTVDIFKGNGPRVFSLLLSVNAITVVVLSPLLTSLTQKVDSLKCIVFGGVFYFFSFGLFSISESMMVFVLSIIIMTIGEILITINVNAYIAKATPKVYMGRVNSLLFIVNGVGYAIGPIVMGNIIVFTSFKNAWLLVATLMLGATVSMYFMSRFEKINAAKKYDEGTDL